MNKKFLKCFLILGNILAISPWLDRKRYGRNNHVYQIYVLLVFAVNLEEYIRYEKREIDIYRSGKRDIVLILLNSICITTISANFLTLMISLSTLKFEKWNLMRKYLAIVEKDLKSYRSIKKAGILDNTYVNIFLMTLIFWISYFVYFWEIGPEMTYIFFENVALIYHWYVVIFIYIRVAKIHAGVRKLGAFLKNFVSPENGNSGKSIKFVTSIRPLFIYTQFIKSYRFVFESIQIFNDIFGYHMVLLNLISTFEVLRGINYIILLAKSNNLQTRIIVAVFLQIAAITLGIILIILMCAGVTRDAEHFLYLLHQMEEDSINMKYKSTVIQLVEDMPLRFSAARFFNISKSTILGIIANCTTYFIVLVQFYQEK